MNILFILTTSKTDISSSHVACHSGLATKMCTIIRKNIFFFGKGITNGKQVYIETIKQLDTLLSFICYTFNL